MSGREGKAILNSAFRIAILGDDFTPSALFEGALQQALGFWPGALAFAVADMVDDDLVPYVSDEVHEAFGNPAETTRLARDAHLLVTTFAPVTAGVLDEAPGLIAVVCGRGRTGEHQRRGRQRARDPGAERDGTQRPGGGGVHPGRDDRPHTPNTRRRRLRAGQRVDYRPRGHLRETERSFSGRHRNQRVRTAYLILMMKTSFGVRW